MPWPPFEHLIIEMYQALGRIEGRLGANTDRLDRIEDRLNADKIKLTDLAPFLIGCLFLALTLLGKPELAAAVASAFGR